ncbi:hypothetical protein [Shewanella algae]|uniref:hypothetical protein n=1 Tax=Shewanella algae TaxID=38313 RepID=UPI00165596DA|nr:hypothetical protein [Shewanella algae]MBC8797671.1 hypothetical protein [Shewanella algae]
MFNLPYQPLNPAFFNLYIPSKQCRCSDPQFPPHLFNIQLGIGAGVNANVTVPKQLTGGLPVVSTSATTHHATTGDRPTQIMNGDTFALAFARSPAL